jgi:hypothetical protein
VAAAEPGDRISKADSRSVHATHTCDVVSPSGISQAGGRIRCQNGKHLPLWARKLSQMVRAIEKIKAISVKSSTAEQFVEPVVTYAREELKRWLARRKLSYSAVITSSFEKQLGRRLLQTGKHVIDLRLQAMEAASYSLSLMNRSVGVVEPNGVFLGDYGASMISLFETYPALARLWSELVWKWVSKVGELIARLASDRAPIVRAFFRGRDLGSLRAVKCDISDPHNGGRETVILRFDHGAIVYKPRAGHNEQEWFSLLRWINREGFGPRLRTLRVLSRRRYCWVEFIEPAPRRNATEAKDYYRRAGGLLCLTYLMGMIDCHRDNIIAAGDQPVLIDAETMFHRQSEALGYKGPATLLHTGLLPVPTEISPHAYNVSGLGGDTPGAHTPMRKGEIISLLAHAEDVARGFEKMWKLIGHPKTATGSAFRTRLHQLRSLRWRRVCYPTSSYLEIRDASFDPASLQSGTARWRKIEMATLRKGLPKWILRREIRSLMRLDVPYFTERPQPLPAASSSPPLREMLRWIRSALNDR